MGGSGYTFHKPLGVLLVGGLQDLLTLIQNRLSSSEMNIGRGEKTEGRVVMFVVVPAEELCCPGAGILLTAEAVRIIRAVFQRFELGFGEWIIVRDMRTRMSLRDTQIGHEQCHGFRRHRTTAVRMDRELLWLNVLADTGSRDQFFSQAG